MVLSHNLPGITAGRNMSKNRAKLSKNLEKLSSGYRINRAGDDAAGLAISEGLRWEINGVEQAKRNIQDGIWTFIMKECKPCRRSHAGD